MTEPRRFVPGTPEHAEAWRMNPKAIYDELTEAERHDPAKNPLHRYADSWAPGHQHEWLEEMTYQQRLRAQVNAQRRHRR